MEVLKKNSVGLKGVCVVLGFFDGIHAGHVEVLSSAVKYAKDKNVKTVLLTFSSAPAEYFNRDFTYIYPREISYELISNIGIDYIVEKEFSSLAQISAEKYLKSLVEEYSPVAIFSGFNHTFGLNRVGNPEYLDLNSKKYCYEYFSISACKFNDEQVSSTLIKKYLAEGFVEYANKMLTSPFLIESIVVEGMKLGRKLGFPTANMKYPIGIVKLPYGVYKIEVFNKLAILNWGIKPTINNDCEEVLEVHIPNFNSDLYGKTLRIKVLQKIRDEKRFSSIDELKEQISKDVETCLKL